MIVGTAQHVAHLEEVGEDSGRFLGLQGVGYDIGVLREYANEVERVGFGEEREVGGGGVVGWELGGGFAVN